MKKRWILIFGLLLSSCAHKQKDITKVETNFVQSLAQSDYQFAKNEKLSLARDVHRERNRKVNIQALRKGMMEISKNYFSPDNYLLNVIDILSYDRLTKSNNLVFDDVALLNYASEENAYGLNPKKDEEFTIQNEKIIGPAFLSDIFELDFVRKNQNEISAMTTALVLSKKPFNQSGKEVEVDDKILVEFGKDASNRLKNFLQTLPQLKDVPIIVALYVSNSEDIHIPGRFIGYTLYSDQYSKYVDFNERYYYLGTSSAKQKNGDLNNIFNIFVSDLNTVLYENVGVVGLVRTVEGEVIDLSIEVNAKFKSFIEEELMIKKILSSISHFKDDKYTITLTLKDNNNVVSIFTRNRLQQNVIYTRR